MGRPLFSALYAPVAPTVRVVESPTPEVERWSYVNAFDPDADEFFEGDNCVFEDFLPLEENAAIAEEVQAQQEQQAQMGTRRVDGVESHRSRELLQRMLNTPGPEDYPELISPSESSSTASEASHSGRSTPANNDEVPPLFSRRHRAIVDARAEIRRRMDARLAASEDAPSAHEDTRAVPVAANVVIDLNDEGADDVVMAPSAPLEVEVEDSSAPPRVSRSALRASLEALTRIGREMAADIPVPASPRPVPARAVSPGPTPSSFDSLAFPGSPGSFDAFVGSPGSLGSATPGAGVLAMTPPGSVTPRFLTWGGAGSRRPHAVDMSPSPTPGAPFGSARAMAHMSPSSFLRVQQ